MSRVAYDEIDVNGVLHVVSTINRQSSCVHGGTYAETMVFIAGRPIWQGEDCDGSTSTHDMVVSKLRNGMEV